MSLPTDEQLNIAMCVWMWWTDIEPIFAAHRGVPPANYRGDTNRDGRAELPNYLSDDSQRRLLNEAEARLTNGQRRQYLNNLAEISDDNGDTEFFYVCASARQRAIAILQTVKPEIFK